MPADVVTLWEAAGRPAPNWQGKAKTARTQPPTRPGICALTGVRGDVVDARHVLSDSFTTWDRFRYATVDPQGLAFGPAACWALRHRAGMQRPHALIDGTYREVTAPELFDALHNLDDKGFVAVPQSRQKHLTPWAQLGTIRVDDENLRWTSTDVDRLDTYMTLRQAGFGETALMEREPRWAILTRLSGGLRRQVLDMWHRLDPWRAHPAYMDVAARATRPAKEDLNSE